MNRIFTLLPFLLLCFAPVRAQVELEPNNTIIQNTAANTFLAPVSISANITRINPDDRDYFKIELPYCAAWKFNIVNPNGSPCILKMYLYNNQNTSSHVFTSSGKTFDFNAGLPAPVVLNCGGPVYIQIDQTSGNDLGAYSLSVTEDVFNGLKCNNSFASAPLIPLDTILDERLWGYSCNGQSDAAFYKLQTPRCGVLEANVTGVNANQRIVMQVYDSLFNLVDQNTASGNGANATLNPLLEVGTYYLKVYEWTGGCCSPGYNFYHLSTDPFVLTTTFDTTDVAECNNSFPTAFPIPLDTVFDAKLWGVNFNISNGQLLDRVEDQDFYVVYAPRCGVWEVTLTGANVNQRMQIDVYDSLYTLINRKIASGNGANVTSATLLEKGVNYLHVREWTGGCCSPGYNSYHLADDPYTLTAAFDTSDAAECNNAFPNGYPLPLDTVFDAKLWGINYVISDGQHNDRNEDQDYYVVDVPECGEWSLDITGVNTAQRMHILVYDTLLNLVDNSIAPSSGANVSLTTLLSPDRYYLRIVEWTGGCCSQGYNVYSLANDPFTVEASFAPLSNFTSSSDTVCLGDPVSFVGAFNNITSWLWDFGPNATPSSSTQQVENGVVFNQAGPQTVTLSVNGCSVDTVVVEVLPLAATPTVSLSGQTLTSSAMSGNQWYLNGAAIAGATASTYTAAVSGVYHVCVSDSSTCGVACSDTLQVTLVGLENRLGELVTVFPNPTTGSFAVEFPFDVDEVIVSNSLGQVVIREVLSLGQRRLDLELQKTGVYFISLYGPEGVARRKLVVGGR